MFDEMLHRVLVYLFEFYLLLLLLFLFLFLFCVNFHVSLVLRL